MKILCINQFFWPDLAPTSQLLSDVVRRLDTGGHHVTVICGAGVYAHQDERNPISPRVHVQRIADFGFSRGPVARLLSYFHFFFAALLRALLVDKPDVVLTMTTPPLISLVGTLVKLLKKSRHVIWEMDLYPDIAVDLGMLSSTSIIAKLVGYFADAQRRRADVIISLGECMSARLVAHGLDRSKIQIAHNWADGNVFFPRPSARPEALACVYAGNFGLGHDAHTLTSALDTLHSDARINFRFVGGGARYNELREICQRLGYETITFKPYCTASELAANEFPTSNVGLVLQDARCSGSIVPSKVYSLLAAGLPILFVGPKSATPAGIVEHFACGWCLEPGDPTALVSLLRRLADQPDEIRRAGLHARRAFLENFDQPLGTQRIVGILAAVDGARDNRAALHS